MKALVKEQMGTGQAPAVFKTQEQRHREGKIGTCNRDKMYIQWKHLGI